MRPASENTITMTTRTQTQKAESRRNRSVRAPVVHRPEIGCGANFSSHTLRKRRRKTNRDTKWSNGVKEEKWSRKSIGHSTRLILENNSKYHGATRHLFLLIVYFTSYLVFSIAVLPHSPWEVYCRLLLRRLTRIPGVAPFSFRIGIWDLFVHRGQKSYTPTASGKLWTTPGVRCMNHASS